MTKQLCGSVYAFLSLKLIFVQTTHIENKVPVTIKYVFRDSLAFIAVIDACLFISLMKRSFERLTNDF